MLTRGFKTAVIATLTGATILLAGCNAKVTDTGTNNRTNTLASSNTTNQGTPTKQNPNLQSAVAYLKGRGSQAPIGAASLTVDKKTKILTVVVEVSGLSTKQRYKLVITNMAEKTLYHLTGITSDTAGSATSLTTIKNISAVSSGWVIQVLDKSGQHILSSGAVETGTQ